MSKSSFSTCHAVIWTVNALGNDLIAAG
jgi:hypothetical protein